MLFKDNPIDRLDDPGLRARESLLSNGDGRGQKGCDGRYSASTDAHLAEGGSESFK